MVGSPGLTGWSVNVFTVHCFLLLQIFTPLLDPPSQPANGRRPAATARRSHLSVPPGYRHTCCHSDSHIQLYGHSSIVLGDGLVVRLDESTGASGRKPGWSIGAVRSQAHTFAGARRPSPSRARAIAIGSRSQQHETADCHGRSATTSVHSDTHNTLNSHRLGDECQYTCGSRWVVVWPARVDASGWYEVTTPASRRRLPRGRHTGF